MIFKKKNQKRLYFFAESFNPGFLIHEFFQYVFRIDNVNSDFDNFVIIDDIEYDAVMCSEASNALDLGKNFYTTPMLSALLNRPVYSANVKFLSKLLYIFLGISLRFCSSRLRLFVGKFGFRFRSNLTTRSTQMGNRFGTNRCAKVSIFK